MNYIDEQKINDLLARTKMPQGAQVKDVLKKALSLNGLSLEEVSVLIGISDEDLLRELYSTAKEIKKRIYGNRLVLFAPLYLTNRCINNCLYCGFRRDNQSLKRKTLTKEEIVEETRALLSQGHKRTLLVAGESVSDAGVDYVVEVIKIIYETEWNGAKIRRINVNVAPLTGEGFAKLKGANIGTYQLFQETYHRATYKIMHPDGPKSDYEWRIGAFERAFRGGIDDLGIGVLFGLYDWRFEVLAMLSYIKELERRIGVGPHTISVPRVEPASGSSLSSNPPYAVCDKDFSKIVAILRLAVPYTGIILTTREKPQFRNELFSLGVSQISAASRTFPGAYKGGDGQNEQMQQFHLGDTRSLEEVIEHIMKDGILPSFCTACYRVGRTGEDFMALAKPGLIQKFCLPNALLTLKEYLEDYAPERVKVIGKDLIKKESREIKDTHLKQMTLKKLKEIENGRRDIYF
jgi:2-iminoacetate synthase